MHLHGTVLTKATIFFAGLALIITAGLASAGADMNAREIMEKNFFVIKVKTVKSTAVMTLINEKGAVRERRVTMTAKLQQNGIDSNIVIRFLYPPDIQGTGFLQLENSTGDDNLWIYLPALKKSRRLVANNKKDSFFGTDFSYGDILPPKVDLSRHALLRSEAVNGRDCYVVESVPKDETVRQNSGYGRKITWVDKGDFLENKVEYYDTDGHLLKTQEITEHKQVDPVNHHWIALRREMKNHKTGHKTVIVFSKVEVGMPISDDFFTSRTLER